MEKDDKYIRYLKSKHLIREVLIKQKQDKKAWEELKKEIDKMYYKNGEWIE